MRARSGGSLVAYALGITDLDLWLTYWWLPTRAGFHADFDVDFCGRTRPCHRLCRATMASTSLADHHVQGGGRKAVVRDVGEFSGIHGLVDQLAKLIPFEVGRRSQRRSNKRRLYKRPSRREVRQLFDMARELEGLARNPVSMVGW